MAASLSLDAIAADLRFAFMRASPDPDSPQLDENWGDLDGWEQEFWLSLVRRVAQNLHDGPPPHSR
jgi:hypothetical protein